jgi:uncharacterized protein (TIGR03089 family)
VNARRPLDTGRWPDSHLGALVALRTRALGQRPAITFVDGVSGERTELGWASLENWTAKAGNLLAEEVDLGPGDVLASDLGTHWTALVVVLGAWRVGAAVALPGASAGALAAAHREDRPRPSGDRAVVVGTGLGGRLTGPAEGVAFAEEVLARDDLLDDHDGAPGEAALLVPEGGGTAVRSHARVLELAGELAERAALQPGGRYASALPADTEVGLVAAAGLLLGLGGGLVLATGHDTDALARLVATERCDALLVPEGLEPSGTDVPVLTIG